MYPEPDLREEDIWFSPVDSKPICPHNDGYVKLNPMTLPTLQEIRHEGWEDYIEVFDDNAD